MAEAFTAATNNQVHFTPEKLIWAVLDLYMATYDPGGSRCAELMISRVAKRFPVRKVPVDHWTARAGMGVMSPAEYDRMKARQAAQAKPASPAFRVFTYNEGRRVRCGMKDGKVWFAAKDICDILGIRNHRDALTRLDPDEKGVGITDSPGGPQKMATVTESGLYALVFKSRLRTARKFRRWVTGEVLPAIRREGKYETKQIDLDCALDALDCMIGKA